MSFSGGGFGSGALQGAAEGSLSGSPWGVALGGLVGGITGGIGAGAESSAIHDAAHEQLKSLKKAQRLYQGQYDETAPARATLLRIAARPADVLDPYQEREIADQQRQQQAGLAASGERGSGRAVAASMDSLNRARERLVSGNRAEQLGVAGHVADVGYATLPQIANTEIERGQVRAERDSGEGGLSADLAGSAGGAAIGFGTGMLGGGYGGQSPFAQLGGYLGQQWKNAMAPSTPTTLYPTAAPSMRNSLGRLSGPV